MVGRKVGCCTTTCSLVTHTPAAGCCSTLGLLQQQIFGGAPTYARALAWWRALAVGCLCERERTHDRSHLHSLCAGQYFTVLAPLLCVSGSPFSVHVPYFFLVECCDGLQSTVVSQEVETTVFDPASEFLSTH